MKRTTYIMFTLIIAGIVLIASLFSYVKIAGVECDSSWKNAPDIANEVEKSQLPRFTKLNISYEYIDEEGNSRSGYVSGGIKMEVITDSLTAAPYVSLPVNFAKDINTSSTGDTLNLTIVMAHRYYTSKKYSAPITICLPPNASLNTMIYHADIPSFVSIKNLKTDQFNANFSDNVNLDLFDCRFDKANIDDVNFVYLYTSKVDSMTIRGTDYSEIEYDPDTQVAATLLKGNDISYELTGVNNFTALPDSGSSIRITQVYNN